jgi:hypothetical protein
MKTTDRSKRHLVHLALVVALAPWLAACEGDEGPQGPKGDPGDPGGNSDELSPEEDPPGINVEILSVSGASGSDGSFQVGNQVRVTYTVKKDDGTAWDLAELSTGRALLSGPTFNYQRVLAEKTDLIAESVENADGSFTYTFAEKVPATYLAPYNDSPSFGPLDGELAGQALLAGSYTLAVYFRWDYSVDGEEFRDQGEALQDLLFLGADTPAPRELVLQESCNRCHSDLRAHGGNRKGVGLCLLCHTAGSEDDNDPSVAGGTPGVSVEFKVMIHKIHAGEHLPSVLGVGTNPDGSRNYAVPPEPYLLSGDDFSHVAFPAWPNLNIAMPRDEGYSALGSPEKALEDTIRMGPTDCSVCHGDPDGAGPLPPPAQGSVAYAQPTRRACGACHDDIDWTLPYTSNGSTMPAQDDDSACILCHGSAGSGLAVVDAHVHPLKNPLLNPGLVFQVLSASEAGANDGDGTIDPGEKVQVSFNLLDDLGAEVDPAEVVSMNATFAGPTTNSNLVLFSVVPAAALTGLQPFTINLPERRMLEFLGDSTGGSDVFATGGSPVWTAGDAAVVYARTGSGGGSSSLSSAATSRQNFVDVADASGFARDDYVVLDDGVPGLEEYLRIQWVDGNRLWFSSPNNTSYPPGTTQAHGAGTSVVEVALTQLAAGVDYSLDPALGLITELSELGAGTAVVVTYTTDFVVPGDYPIPINDSPDLGETSGEWRGKSLVDGTYTVGLWGNTDATLSLFGESNSYRGTSRLGSADVLVGSAGSLEPYALISSEQDCYDCHVDMYFHGGGRRGVETCLACHGTAGAEDRPQYVAPGAPATTGVSVSFREMLHKIHMGEDLAHASTYEVVGFGSSSLYPDNFSENTYEDVVFPALPQGVKNCGTCHGADNEAWKEPADREHPSEQTKPVLEWRIVCGSCHDSDGAMAHIGTQTDPVSGLEACSVCHGIGEDLEVELVHKPR